MEHCFKLCYKANEIRRIFGKNFVKRNKNKCKIIHNNKEYQLKEFFEEINKNHKPGIEIKFKLRFFHNILNLRGMFFNCDNLLSMKDDSKFNEEQVNASSKYGLSIAKKQEKESFKITDIGYMFYGCKSLISIPDISEWNTEKLANMFCLFCGCNSLISIPDISEWNTENVTNMDNMFYRCNSLVSIPDISKWNIKNLFYNFELVYQYDNHLRILGKKFIINNINKCYINYQHSNLLYLVLNLIYYIHKIYNLYF